MGRSKENLLKLFEYINTHPIIDITKTSIALKLSYNTINQMIDKLIEAKILVQNNDQQRHRLFSYKDYLDILRKDT